MLQPGRLLSLDVHNEINMETRNMTTILTCYNKQVMNKLEEMDRNMVRKQVASSTNVPSG